jgi:hypothetical protein
MDQSAAILAGIQPSKQTKYGPLGTRRFFTGWYNSRNPLQEPGTRAESRFYGGRPDALWDGSNVEISADNTPIRRPGSTLFATLPHPALDYYTFQPPNAPITIFADTIGGPYNLTASSTPTVPLFVKAEGAGLTNFLGVGAQLFLGDGVDLLKWDGTTVSKWGIAPPVNAPTLTITGGAPPPTPVLVATVAGSLTGQGTKYVQITGVGPFGETCSSSEALLAIPDGSELVVMAPVGAPTNITHWNVYIGNAAGSEKLQNLTPILLTVNFTLTGAPSTSGAVAPTSSTNGAYTITSPLGVSYGYCYENDVTDHVSTMSPPSAYTGPQQNVQILVAGTYSPDAQVTTVQIYRTTDGGATYLLEASIANVVGTGAFSYTDTGNADSSLNVDIQAPQALANNPPPAGMKGLCYFNGSIWGYIDNLLVFSNGPLTTNGSGNESFPPLNFALMTAGINRLVPTPTALLIFCQDALWSISGQGAIPVLQMPGLGTPSYNAVDLNGSAIYVFTTDCNVLCITPGAGIVDLGFGIAKAFEGLTVGNVSVAYHISGHKDNALFVCDGAGHFWRCNPNQQPEGGAVWSNTASIAGGASAITSIESSVGVHQLVYSNGNDVLFRDWTSWTDNGTAYDAWTVFGSLVLALPGQLCEVQCVTIEAEKQGSQPAVSVLLDEISGDFEALPLSEPDPPGDGTPSASLFSNRHYLNQSTEPVVCRHLQLRVDFGLDEAQNELLSYSLYGSLHPE